MVEKSFEKINTPPVVQPPRKRRGNSASASVPFTQLKNDRRTEQNTESEKQNPPDKEFEGLKPLKTNILYDDRSQSRKGTAVSETNETMH